MLVQASLFPTRAQQHRRWAFHRAREAIFAIVGQWKSSVALSLRVPTAMARRRTEESAVLLLRFAWKHSLAHLKDTYGQEPNSRREAQVHVPHQHSARSDSLI